MTQSPRGWLVKVSRYGVTGGVAAVADLAGFAVLLASGVSLPAAAFLSFLIATVLNYALTARFVFAATISTKGYLRFLMFASVGLAVNVMITVLIAAAGAPAMLAKLAGIAIAFGFNFLVNAIFVFPRARQPRR